MWGASEQVPGQAYNFIAVALRFTFRLPVAERRRGEAVLHLTRSLKEIQNRRAGGKARVNRPDYRLREILLPAGPGVTAAFHSVKFDRFFPFVSGESHFQLFMTVFGELSLVLYVSGVGLSPDSEA